MLNNNSLIVEVWKTALTFSSKLILSPVQLQSDVKASKLTWTELLLIN